MICRLAGVVVDARFAVPDAAGPAARARAAQWIAANALACRGLPFAVEGALPRGARALVLRASSFAATLAAIAAMPVLVDLATLPWHRAYLLRALGLPVLSESPAAAIRSGASVLGCLDDPTGCTSLAVDECDDGYRVRVAAARCMLAS